MKTLPSSTTVDWYRLAGPAIVRHLGGVPLVTARYFRGHQTFAASLHEPAPGHEATVDVISSGGRVEYLALTETSMLYQAHKYAVEVHSWSPRQDDPERAGFARLIISPHPDRHAEWAAHVATIARQVLHARNLDGIALRDRGTSLAIWMPFADGPKYDVLRAWMHALSTGIVAADPAIDIAELHVSTNAVGRWSMVPYSMIGPGETTAVTPIRWAELGTIPAALPCDVVLARLADDVFDAEVRRIGAQRFGGGPITMVSGSGHGQILAAVRAILADGKAHSAEDICRAGIAQGLLTAGTIPAYVQHGISTLLDRERDRGEKPEFLIEPNGDYRLNVPIDPYAGFAQPAADRTKLDALIATLRSTVTRETPATPDDGPNIGAPFERAVAEAFAFVGLESARLGGEGEPDVVVTAPLGSLMYRTVIECKTVATVKLHGSAAFVVEAQRMRDNMQAAYAVLLGLDFPDERGITEELATHNVALWTLEDLITVLECQQHHPIAWTALRPLLTAGRVGDRVAQFKADHLHGSYTRSQLALRYAIEEGLAYQRSLETEAAANEDALLTVESLTLLVNQRMAREGMAGRCSSADIRSAVTLATSPAIGYAELVGGSGIVIDRAYADRNM